MSRSFAIGGVVVVLLVGLLTIGLAFGRPQTTYTAPDSGQSFIEPFLFHISNGQLAFMTERATGRAWLLRVASDGSEFVWLEITRRIDGEDSVRDWVAKQKDIAREAAQGNREGIIKGIIPGA